MASSEHFCKNLTSMFDGRTMGYGGGLGEFHPAMIHSHGFYDYHKNAPNEANESLHTAIALGAFGNVVAYATETGQEHSIRVFTDRINPPVMRGFFDAFEEYLDDDPVVAVVKRGHRNPEMRQKAWGLTQSTRPEGFDAESFHIEGFSIDLDANESGLTVAADFVAGALNPCGGSWQRRRSRHDGI